MNKVKFLFTLSFMFSLLSATPADYHCHTLFPYHPTEGSAVGIIVAYFTNSL